MTTIKISQKVYEEIRKKHPMVSAVGQPYADHSGETLYWSYDLRFETEVKYKKINANVRIHEQFNGKLRKVVTLIVGAGLYLEVVFNNYHF